MIPEAWNVRTVAYAAGQTVEVCLEFGPPLARGARFVVSAFENDHGDLAGLTDAPAGVSECFLRKPAQTALRGRASHPGLYGPTRLRVEHLRGVTHVDPPGIGFEVRSAPEVVGWRLS